MSFAVRSQPDKKEAAPAALSIFSSWSRTRIRAIHMVASLQTNNRTAQRSATEHTSLPESAVLEARLNRLGYACSDTDRFRLCQVLVACFKRRISDISDQEILRCHFEYRKPIDIEEIECKVSRSRTEVWLQGKFFADGLHLYECVHHTRSAITVLKKAIEHFFHPITISNVGTDAFSTASSMRYVSRLSVLNEAQRTFIGYGVDSDKQLSRLRALVDAVNHAYIETYFRIR